VTYGFPAGTRPGKSGPPRQFLPGGKRRRGVWAWRRRVAAQEETMDIARASFAATPADRTGGNHGPGGLCGMSRRRFMTRAASAGALALTGGQALAQTPARVPNGATAEIRKLYYDTAQSANPENLGALMSVVPDTQILFGTDYPYLAPPITIEPMERLALSEDQRTSIARDNALRLFPRLRT
jgi:Amidohydrolase